MLDKELAAAHRAGLRDVHFVERAPLSFFDTGPCLRFPRQGQFHPLHYLTGLARAIERRRGRIFTGTHATEIAGGRPGLVKTTANGSIRADAIVVATNTPINDRVVMHTKQAPYRSYVVGLRVPRGAVPKGLYWDTPDPYHYVRLVNMPQGGDELLIVGGEDHKTGQVADTVEPLPIWKAGPGNAFPWPPR